MLAGCRGDHHIKTNRLSNSPHKFPLVVTPHHRIESSSSSIHGRSTTTTKRIRGNQSISSPSDTNNPQFTDLPPSPSPSNHLQNTTRIPPLRPPRILRLRNSPRSTHPTPLSNNLLTLCALDPQ